MEYHKVKKFFIMLILWVVGILAVFIGSELYRRHQASTYGEAAVPYIKQVIPEISRWDPERTRELMVPEVVANIPEERFDRVIAYFSRLGELKSLAEPEFKQAHVEQKIDIGEETILEYDVDAVYESGPAEIRIELIEGKDGFEVYRFDFRSEVLATREGS